MSTTIQQSLRPLFLIYFIMGLGVYPTKQLKSKFRWIAHLSILYSLTIWFIYGYVLFFTFTIFSPKLLFWSITGIVIMATVNFNAITSAILIFYHYKRLQIYMKRLAAVDDTLEKLGTPKTYQKLHILSKRLIIGWTVQVLIANIHEIIWSLPLVKEVSGGFLLINILYHSARVNEFTDLIFIFLLWYIGTRFDKINDHMHCLLLKEEHGVKHMWRKSIDSYGYFLHRHNYKRTLWTSMHLHSELCCIARELNIIFGLQITSEIALYFGWLTVHCYYLYRHLGLVYQEEASSDDIFGFAFWLVTCLIRLFAVNHICESVKNKANNISKIIHQLTNNLKYADIWNEIYFFALQVMQHPLEFTGLGLFYLGNKFLQQFFSTVVKYVIIMAQLKMQ